jgi:hypothetical protein
MKTMMKKCGVYAAFAVVLLVMAALVTGCPESSGYQFPAGTGYQPPAGMGSVRLIFNETIERATILPDNVTISNFQEFVLTFTAVSGGAVTPAAPITRDNAHRNDAIDLVPGVYSLVVVARLTEGDAATAAATWSNSSINITAGNTTALAITLRPYDPATSSGTGTFAWTITNSITGGISSIGAGSQMSLTTLAGAAVDLPPPAAPATPAIWSLTTVGNWNNTTGVVFPSNYYYVDITLIVNGATRNFRHVLHLYQNMKSTFNYAFTDDHIGVELITFTPTITYTHPTDNPPLIGVGKVSSNAVSGTGTADDPYLLSLTDNNYPSDLIISVTNVGTFTGGIKYYHGTTLLKTGSPLTLDTGSTPPAPFDAAGGPHQIMVEGIVGASNGAPYYAEIFIKVDEDL